MIRALIGGDSRNGKFAGLIPESVHVTRAPRNAVAVPKYGPRTSPNTVATSASRFMCTSPIPIGMCGLTSESM